MPGHIDPVRTAMQDRSHIQRFTEPLCTFYHISDRKNVAVFCYSALMRRRRRTRSRSRHSHPVKAMAHFAHRRWQNLCLFLWAVSRTPPAAGWSSVPAFSSSSCWASIGPITRSTNRRNCSFRWRMRYEESSRDMARIRCVVRGTFDSHYYAGAAGRLGPSRGAGNPVARTYWRWRFVCRIL